MNISIKNLGPIGEADLVLKPLTLFIGPNNSGKSWIAYVLAGVLGSYGWQRYLRGYLDGQTQVSYPPLEQAFQQLLNEGNAKIDMVQFADTCAQDYFNDVARLARQWMQEFMGTERVSFADLEITVEPGERKERLLQQARSFAVEFKLSVGQRKETALLNASKATDDPACYFYTTAGADVQEKLPDRVIKEFVFGTIFGVLHQMLYTSIHIFPTDRTTFITYRPQLIPSDELAKTREAIQKEEPRRLMPVPVADFVRLMENIFRSSLARREKQTETTPTIQNYLDLASLLEHDILGGTLNFSTPEPDLHRDLLFQVPRRGALDMSVVSSMVKDLAPLVLYLRYVATKNDLIIIDEPEMNLHPEVQVKMTEFLAMLVNAGVSVLITTHSPYIVDHLENLMAAAAHPDPEEIREKFFLQQSDAFIDRANVGAYLVDQGTVKSVLQKEEMIDWTTFGNIADRLTRIYFDL